jgi:hypothetical protein
MLQVMPHNCKNTWPQRPPPPPKHNLNTPLSEPAAYRIERFGYKPLAEEMILETHLEMAG